jgi:hypothetical protein
MKYGRKKLEKMGLDPKNYTEDFIFALRIQLGEVDASLSVTAAPINATGNISLARTATSPLTDLQGVDQHVTGTLAGKYNDVTTASVDIDALLICVLFSVNTKGPGQPHTGYTGLRDAIRLYGSATGTGLYFSIGFTVNTVASKLLTTFSNIHGFHKNCMSSKKNTAGVYGMKTDAACTSGTLTLGAWKTGHAVEVAKDTKANKGTTVFSDRYIATYNKINKKGITRAVCLVDLGADGSNATYLTAGALPGDSDLQRTTNKVTYGTNTFGGDGVKTPPPELGRDAAAIWASSLTLGAQAYAAAHGKNRSGFPATRVGSTPTPLAIIVHKINIAELAPIFKKDDIYTVFELLA